MSVEIDSYYLKKEEPIKGCLLALRTIILDHDTLIQETQKWGMPCFCYKKKPFCYLSIDKKTNTPYMLFVEGRLLEHPSLEKGDREKMKSFSVDPSLDLPLEKIQLLLTESIALYKNGIIKVK